MTVVSTDPLGAGGGAGLLSTVIVWQGVGLVGTVGSGIAILSSYVFEIESSTIFWLA